MRGYHDQNPYFNNPVEYIKNAHHPHHLAQVRQPDIILVVGRNDPNFGHNQYFSTLLWEKNIWHAFRVWDGWAHDWPWWRHMLSLYIGGPD
ncbi:MAG: hypothetical protein H0T73_16235 [Ardenticatenales bacterium]|nr:hypothetical protein [Ardenticatenales bacterium]